jgi:hypothetical protein
MFTGSVVRLVLLFSALLVSKRDFAWVRLANEQGVLVYNGANSYIVDAYAGGSTASAMAAKTLLSRLCGASVVSLPPVSGYQLLTWQPMFVDRFYASAIGIEWASGVLAFIALVRDCFHL